MRKKPSGWKRIAAALGTGLLAFAAVGPLCLLAYNSDRDAAKRATLDVARGRIEQVLVSWRDEGVEIPGNVWRANPNGEWFDAVGEVWTDPQVMSLAEPVASGGELIQEYTFNGEWLAVAQWVGGDDVLVSVVGRDNEVAAISSLKRRWSAISLAIPALAALLSYLVFVRLRRPLQHAHNVNRDFIADAAHELRTPLSIIQASAGHALARQRDETQYRQSLQEILQATERAGSSVGELLEFARLEAGQASPRLAPLRLDLLAEEVASSVRVDGVEVKAEVGESVVVEADYNLLRQVVDNIVHNAAARASNVTITTKAEAKRARVEIADDGPGFDPSILPVVFERFRRGDRSGSTGLGMAIARSIVELHGGTCEASNRPEGGALVTVTVPYRAPKGAASLN